MKFSISSARVALLASALSGVSANAPIWAQQNPTAAPAPAPRLIAVESEDVGTLPQTLSSAAAISLGASSADLEAVPASRAALLNWVAGGGVVFLHTDAARAFGYQTVVAREGNPRVAGQLYGRARAALPWAAHPLLHTDARAARPNDVFDLPGVETVFYTLRAGDHLVVNHPAGTPLLEVSDLAANAARPLYAAAIAPYGRGWAVFTPDSVDQRRGDGAAFARNLLTLLPQSAGAPSPYVGVSQSAAADATLRSALDEALAGGSSSALPAFGTTGNVPNPAAGPAPIPNGTDVPVAVEITPGAVNANPNPNPPVAVSAATSPVILMRREQATALRASLATDEANTRALLAARVALLRGDFAAANAALRGARESAETAFVAATIAASAASDVSLASPDRAVAARDAATFFNQAATVRATNNNGGASTNALGVEAAQLRAWSQQFARVANVFALEPPLVQVVGAGEGAITVRFYQNDASVPLVVPGATLLANTRIFGWRTDREEILLFPTPELYLNYRRAAGLNRQNVPLPSATGGDVIGQRILMLAIPASPQLARAPGGQLRVLGARTTSLNLLARLHSYALLGAWLDGGGRVPAWFALGLETVADAVLNGDASVTASGQILQNTAQVGGLLSPAQFESAGENNGIALAQSAALVNYFYRVSGPGRVTEVVARLGAGQNTDDALQEVTGADQITLFRAWRDAQFGPQRFPNAG